MEMGTACNSEGIMTLVFELLQLFFYGGGKMSSILGTLIVAGILILVIGLAVFSMIRDKKNGKSLQCGCDCKNCGGHCRNGDLK